MDEEIKLLLTRSEAVVLYEFLTRFSENQVLQIHDQAEARVLWNLQCDLETSLTEPFDVDYTKIIEKARNDVRDEE